jgi:hypothetical protein
MCTEYAVRILAGIFVLAGTILAVLVSPWFLLLTGFVGVNLIQSALTGFCPAEMIFRRLGLKSQCGPAK